jgi:hypothetical protein
MKSLSPLLLALAACQVPSTAPDELATLRQEIAELKVMQQPGLDAVAAMDDLAREVKQLRQRIATPPPSPLPLPLLVPPLPAEGTVIKNHELTGGVGGTQSGINDLFWVLSKLQVNGEERAVLCLYRASTGREGIQLTGVRLLNYDQMIIEYNSSKPSVKEVIDTIQKGQRK